MLTRLTLKHVCMLEKEARHTFQNVNNKLFPPLPQHVELHHHTVLLLPDRWIRWVCLLSSPPPAAALRSQPPPSGGTTHRIPGLKFQLLLSAGRRLEVSAGMLGICAGM